MKKSQARIGSPSEKPSNHAINKRVNIYERNR